MPRYKNIENEDINLLYAAAKLQIDFETGQDTPLSEVQTIVDSWILADTYRQEAKQFVNDNPGALQLLELSPDDLESAIENRTANQETLLLKTLSFAIRFFYADERNKDN